MLAAAPAQAARPLLEQHQWDRYFALFAQDASLPWKRTTVRLATYSGAAVDFAAYLADPAEVIVAGSARARSIDTSRRKPVARWRYVPAAGYRFATSDVDVPLGSRAGFYVIEARRGDAVQQVWINRSRIGLVTKEGPEGVTLWAADLGTGRPLAGMRLEVLQGGRLVTRSTDRSGLIAWDGRERPRFVLATWGDSRAFLSLLPQPRLPQAVVAVRLDSSSARAGGSVRAVGFVRRRGAGALRPVAGDVRVSVVGHGATVARATAQLDAAGFFLADLRLSPTAPAGDYAVLASASGQVGGTSVHVDAASRETLEVAPGCPCDPSAAVPFSVTAARDGGAAAGVELAVRVVRTPHIVPPGESAPAMRWGTTTVLQTSVRSGPDGRARLTLPPPTDGLSSTYFVETATPGNGATATAQFIVPTAKIALAIEPDDAIADVGRPLGFTVRGFDARSGAPQRGLAVDVRLAHGATAWQQTVRLDGSGTARAVFREAALGSNLATARASAPDGGVALDASSVSVAPRGLVGRSASAGTGTGLVLDRAGYRPHDRVSVSISASGATGYALVTLDGARTYLTRIVPLSGGHARTKFSLPDVPGEARVAAAIVRDGAIRLASTPMAIDAPGHPRLLDARVDREHYAPGDVATVELRDGDAPWAGTRVVRLAEARAEGGARFDEMPAMLSTGGTTSQNGAPDAPSWHAWVAPARSKAADIFAAERPRGTAREGSSLTGATGSMLLWRVERLSSPTFAVPLPAKRGTYVLSTLCIFDDGDVGAATTTLVVR